MATHFAGTERVEIEYDGQRRTGTVIGLANGNVVVFLDEPIPVPDRVEKDVHGEDVVYTYPDIRHVEVPERTIHLLPDAAPADPAAPPTGAGQADASAPDSDEEAAAREQAKQTPA